MDSAEAIATSESVYPLTEGLSAKVLAKAISYASPTATDAAKYFSDVAAAEKAAEKAADEKPAKAAAKATTEKAAPKTTATKTADKKPAAKASE